MSKYLFKLNRDLFDMNVMELDEGLVRFTEEMNLGNEPFKCINVENTIRTFKIDQEESTIHGRGIKGFFRPYDSDYLFIGKRSDGLFAVSSFSSPNTDELKQNSTSLEAAEDTNHILREMASLKKSPEKWIDLYQIAEQFQFDKNDDRLISLPHIREIETYDYQLNTVKSVITRLKGRALFSDEVGLGKTIEAGIAMLEYIMRGLAKKVLILTPPSLVEQWENEMRRKFNQDFVRADDPQFKKMGKEAWGHFPKVIASISMAKRQAHREVISQEYYDLVIIDEAHHVKNRNTQAWKFVNAINKKYIFLLTATPVQNHLEELYNLITLLKPGQLKTYNYFKKQFIESKDGIEAKNIDQLKGLLSDVMIRNKRSNVDVTFTKRKAYTKTIELSDRESRLYHEISSFIREKYKEENPALSRFQLKALQEQMVSTYHSLAESLEKLSKNNNLTEMEQEKLTYFSEMATEIASKSTESHQKAEELIKILSDFDDKMIVFTKFKSTQKYLSELLRTRGFKVAEFHGGLRRKDKEYQVHYFKEEADVLVSTEVGGEGRNLQFCNGMINFDLPWNPMAIEQRIGRIHRIGQTRDVYVYNLVAKDTIEHHILNLLDRKINMFTLVVGEVDMILGDIEEKEDFSDLIMNAWVKTDDPQEIEKALDGIGEKMMQNKQRLLKQKQLDEKIF